jgi:hypothetical protein
MARQGPAGTNRPACKVVAPKVWDAYLARMHRGASIAHGSDMHETSFLAACDSGSASPTHRPDGASDTSLEMGSDGEVPEATIDASNDSPTSETGPDGAAPEAAIDATNDSPISETGPDATADADAGPCTAELDTFTFCPATYPASLAAACESELVCCGRRVTFAFGVSTASCRSLAAIVYGGPPHYKFCLYSGVDAGALIGAEVVTDFPELCNNTAETIVGGQVPPSCQNEIYSQLGVPDSGSTTVQCDGGAPPDGAAD